MYLSDAKAMALHVVGKVKAIAPDMEPTFFRITVTDAKGDHAFMLSVQPVELPFAVGDQIEVNVRRNKSRYFDGQVNDATGKALLVTSESGADDWAGGWKVKQGQVLESVQDPKVKVQSVERMHELEVTRGQTSVHVPPDVCTLVEDNNEQYLVSGSGHSWVGKRPAGAVDYTHFSMQRRPLMTEHR